jgi:Flp pilus assembly pilin Flp
MTWSTIRDGARRLYACERGAEGLEKLLIVGAIVIPLLGVLIFFRDTISQWVEGLFEDVQSDAEADPLG